MRVVEEVLVRVTTPSESRQLLRAGGERWQEYGHVTPDGAHVRWESVVIRVPIAAAVRLDLVQLSPAPTNTSTSGTDAGAASTGQGTGQGRPRQGRLQGRPRKGGP